MKSNILAYPLAALFSLQQAKYINAVICNVAEQLFGSYRKLNLRLLSSLPVGGGERKV